MTQGMKSSEFWMGLFGAAVAFCNAQFGWGFTTEELLSFIGPLMAYVVSRGLAKNG